MDSRIDVQDFSVDFSDGDLILADAICDRIVHDSYSIVIDCKESMRKRKGVRDSDD